MTNMQLFDWAKQEVKKKRSQRRLAKSGNNKSGFLHYLAAEIIAERLSATLRDFERPALLFDGPFAAELIRIISGADAKISGDFIAVEKTETEILPVEPGSFDLIISIFDLHRINDPAAMMLQINHALKPDGLFMGALPAHGSLEEFRQSLFSAELETTGGAGTRIDAFPEIRQIGNLIQNTGFKLPVVDLEQRVIRYSGIEGLTSDLRDNAAGNVSRGNIPPVSRSTLSALKRNYSKNCAEADGKIPVTIKMAMISGWKEDASQQQPLKPGSAKNRLADFL